MHLTSIFLRIQCAHSGHIVFRWVVTADAEWSFLCLLTASSFIVHVWIHLEGVRWAVWWTVSLVTSGVSVMTSMWQHICPIWKCRLLPYCGKIMFMSCLAVKDGECDWCDRQDMAILRLAAASLLDPQPLIRLYWPLKFPGLFQHKADYSVSTWKTD